MEVARARARDAFADLAAVVDHLETVLPQALDRLGAEPEGCVEHSLLPTVAVRLPDGSRAVVKVRLPGELDVEARVMAAAPEAYARVLHWDASTGVLATERLAGTAAAAHPGLAEQVDLAATALPLAWRAPLVAGDDVGSKAQGLLGILAELGPAYGSAHPAALAVATDHARVLAAAERAEVVCHGDPHAGNLLRRGDGWAYVDPDGFLGERAYDLGVALRDASAELLAAEESRTGGAAQLLEGEVARAAEMTGVDADRVWHWAFVERVTTGLYLHWWGRTAEAEGYLGAADVLAAQARR